MNERDRMLAEGPRVAPEPPTADGPVVGSASPPRSSSPPRGWSIPRGLGRLIPFAVFAVVLAANAGGAGKYAFWVIAPIAILVTVIQARRKRRT